MNTLYLKESLSTRRLWKIDPEEIIFIESDGHFLKITYTEGTISILKSIKNLLEILNSFTYFHRIHRSYIISERFILFIDQYNVQLKNDIKIPIGKAYRSSFLSRILNQH